MKFGFRTPSLTKRLAARTSLKRAIRHSAGLKMPRGIGMVTSPKKAIYNKVYNKTSIGVGSFPPGKKVSTSEKSSLYWYTLVILLTIILLFVVPPLGLILIVVILFFFFKKRKTKTPQFFQNPDPLPPESSSL